MSELPRLKGRVSYPLPTSKYCRPADLPANVPAVAVAIFIPIKRGWVDHSRTVALVEQPEVPA